MGALRATMILMALAGLTVLSLPVQAIFVRFSPRNARHLPHWYHRQLCSLLGIRINIDGEIVPDRPLLIIANHSSWLDIPVMSAIAPVSFIAKKEVRSWPGVSYLAFLQRTIFVDRERRTTVRQTTSEIRDRLAAGDALVLFAEGTSSDGQRVLPFKSALFAAVTGGKRTSKSLKDSEAPQDTIVQTLTVAYTRLHGIPLGRADRPFIGWYGDMELLGHAWRLLKSGPIDVEARIGKPLALVEFADRKILTRATESEISENLTKMLRGKCADEDIAVTLPSRNWNSTSGQDRQPSKLWT